MAENIQKFSKKTIIFIISFLGILVLGSLWLIDSGKKFLFKDKYAKAQSCWQDIIVSDSSGSCVSDGGCGSCGGCDS